jgi:hypothetical protein
MIISKVKTVISVSFLVFFINTSIVNAQIKVSENKHYLQTKTGEPFFWLGDTNWEMIHRLSIEEIEILMETRKNQGFNVLQIVALTEFNGLKQPNRYGDIPLKDFDPTKLNLTEGNNINSADEFDYWDLLDKVFDIAVAKGLYIGLLPTWGDKLANMWGDGPRIFNAENARIYGTILGKRYGSRTNIIWILGGDRPAIYEWEKVKYDDTFIWRAMAEGIRDGEIMLNTEHKLMTYHPASGENRTSKYLQNELWLDINAFQSGHSVNQPTPWNWVFEDFNIDPPKPTLDMEPCYEDHPKKPKNGKWNKELGYFDDYDVRKRIYRTVFAGSAGVTYGHHHVWQCMDSTLNKPIYNGDTIIHWKNALHAKAAKQLIYLKKLMLSRPYFLRINDQKILDFEQNNNSNSFITATRDSEGSYAFIYFPDASKNQYKLNLRSIKAKKISVFWFNPQTGQSSRIRKIKKTDSIIVQPPTTMKDVVLIIDNVSKKYSIDF